MLDHFAIFTSGGLVLWALSIAEFSGSPVNDMIKTVLIEGRGSGTDTFVSGSSALKWKRSNDFGLFFVAVYPSAVLKVQYIDELLTLVRDSFIQDHKATLQNQTYLPQHKKFEFDKHFDFLLKQALSTVESQKAEIKAPKAFSQTKKGKEALQDKKKDKKKPEEPEPVPEMRPPTKPVVAGGQRRPANFAKKPKTKPEVATPPKGKKQPGWVADNTTAAPVVVQVEGDVSPEELKKRQEEWGVTQATDLAFDPESSSESEEDDFVPTKAENAGILSYFSNMVNRELTEDDLAPVLEQMRTSLITKNVASEIAENLCRSVSDSLIGKRLGTFGRVKTAVTDAMQEAMTRILTPKRTIDILRDLTNNNRGRPYVITFVGINGVGKSTSLAKVVSWLKQNGQKVLIAACDTFRAAAIEQLLYHARNLEVEVFQQGYGKTGGRDPSSVCAAAIQKATKEKYDVVVVDTAGRMQGNTGLMKELAKLVGVNEPDLVLFVGEALVGNDSVDQLVKFNQALQDLSTTKQARGIDGIILTKFDCVDEKVGAAVSMTYTTGQPVVFVGVGQKYPDLKTLDVKRIVSVLLK